MVNAIIMRSPDSDGKLGGSVTQQADNDDQLIELWLHGRPDQTQRAYRREVDRLVDHINKPLRSVKLIDIQEFSDHLGGSLKESSLNRAMATVKSLFSFGFGLGYFTFDIAKPVKTPAFRDELADRILAEADMLRMISLEPNPRNRAMLLTLYTGGFRVSEICELKWRHLQDRNSAGQITVFGKRGKTRTVLMPQNVWASLQLLQQDSPADAPVFRSRKKGHLDESAVWRIINKASIRAGIDKKVSAHWFRHAYASHALDRGCPIHLVQANLVHSSISTTGRYLHARPADSSGHYLTI